MGRSSDECASDPAGSSRGRATSPNTEERAMTDDGEIIIIVL